VLTDSSFGGLAHTPGQFSDRLFRLPIVSSPPLFFKSTPTPHPLRLLYDSDGPWPPKTPPPLFVYLNGRHCFSQNLALVKRWCCHPRARTMFFTMNLGLAVLGQSTLPLVQSFPRGISGPQSTSSHFVVSLPDGGFLFNAFSHCARPLLHRIDFFRFPQHVVPPRPSWPGVLAGPGKLGRDSTWPVATAFVWAFFPLLPPPPVFAPPPFRAQWQLLLFKVPGTPSISLQDCFPQLIFSP